MNSSFWLFSYTLLFVFVRTYKHQQTKSSFCRRLRVVFRHVLETRAELTLGDLELFDVVHRVDARGRVLICGR